MPIAFSQNGDERGHLVVIEGMKDIKFDIKRVFYIYGSDASVVRGRHANRYSQFVLINVSGTSKVRVDYGNSYEVFELNRPHTGVAIPRMVWKDMYDFSKDSVLLVLSDTQYDPAEYIRDKQEYYREIGVAK
ncbi:MAG: FdtA/QdtA family cupin domain-containing protein [Oscillospiraceae bacterium]|nr:FdtA/QdtA family cupin domain-containing protein [Oscillospiraceae bacterium]